jgi:predicted nucleic acid-binding protein
MVIEAAMRVGAETLYTEELQDGQRIGSMTLVNPFS